MWTTLEQWSSTAFLAAGGLFVLPEIVSGVNAVTGTEIVVSPAAIFTFMLVVFVGLLGLYPRLAERDSTLAKGGVGLLGVTTAMIIPAVGLFTLSTGSTFGEATALAVVVAVGAGFTLTVTTFGVASLRTGARSRPVGGFLLVMAAATSFIVVAMLLYGHSTPSGVEFVVNASIAASLGSIGYVLRTEDVPADSPASTGDVPAD